LWCRGGLPHGFLPSDRQRRRYPSNVHSSVSRRGNQALKAGTYDGALRLPTPGSGAPGLSLWGMGRACDTFTGTFTTVSSDITAVVTLKKV